MSSRSEWTAREFWAVLAGGVLLACVMFWPLPRHMGTIVIHGADDPLLQAWQIQWDAHALLTQPFHFWDANLFYPLHDSLAFSDALVGYAPLGVFGGGPRGALIAYNVAYLFAYAMAVAGPYALARELGIGKPAALVCGLAFAYAPWRYEQSGHLHILSSGTIPLALALWLRGYRSRSSRAIFGGWAVIAWQVLIGVSLGLYALYMTALIALVVAVAWLVRGRVRPPRNVVVATASGMVVVALATAFVAPAYLRVKHDHPEAKRTLVDLKRYSPPAFSLLVASPNNPVWGKVNVDNRNRLPALYEQTLFPGATILLLALIGLLLGTVLPLRVRLALLAAGAVTCVFSLGVYFFGGDFTYKLLFDHAPGWNSVRTPGRLMTFTSLALALLAAAGLQRLLTLGPIGRRRVLVGGLAGVAGLGVLAEGTALDSPLVPGDGLKGAPHAAAPAYPKELASVRAPIMLIPPGEPQVYGQMLWTTRGFPKVVNGMSGFDPTLSQSLFAPMGVFPNRPSVAVLRRYGVRSVVIDTRIIANTPYAGALARPRKGLGVGYRRDGPFDIYAIAPAR